MLMKLALEPDDLSYGETLDLSRGNLRGSFDNKSSGESTSSEEPNNIFNVTNPLPVLPLHIDAKGENRKGIIDNYVLPPTRKKVA